MLQKQTTPDRSSLLNTKAFILLLYIVLGWQGAQCAHSVQSPWETRWQYGPTEPCQPRSQRTRSVQSVRWSFESFPGSEPLTAPSQARLLAAFTVGGTCTLTYAHRCGEKREEQNRGQSSHGYFRDRKPLWSTLLKPALRPT